MTCPARVRAAVAAGLLILASTAATAGLFSVSPVRIFLGPRDRAMAITIVNEGTSPLLLQTELGAWSQQPNGVDLMTPTDEIVIAPPIITIAPKAQQVVRLALLRAADPSRQLTYRLILREVPEAVATAAPGVSVPVALAMNLPIFVSPAMARREVKCHLERDQGLSAVCANSGSAYAQIREANLMRANSEVGRFQGGSYLLPGVTKRVPLTPLQAGAVPGGSAELNIGFDDGQTQVFEVTIP